MDKRYTVSVTESQAADLEYLALSREVSVSQVIRDALRAQLAREVALARFLENPSDDPHLGEVVAMELEALDEELNASIVRHRTRGAGAGAATGGVAPAPPTRRFRRQPPVSNTGANSDKNPGNTGK